MKFEIYCVKDELTDRYMQPQYFENEKMATRQFKSTLNNITVWKDNPADFSLFMLGTFDDATGTMIGITPKKIIGGKSIVENK